jgi:hypothetical protein
LLHDWGRAAGRFDRPRPAGGGDPGYPGGGMLSRHLRATVIRPAPPSAAKALHTPGTGHHQTDQDSGSPLRDNPIRREASGEVGPAAQGSPWWERHRQERKIPQTSRKVPKSEIGAGARLPPCSPRRCSRPGNEAWKSSVSGSPFRWISPMVAACQDEVPGGPPHSTKWNHDSDAPGSASSSPRTRRGPPSGRASGLRATPARVVFERKPVARCHAPAPRRSALPEKSNNSRASIPRHCGSRRAGPGRGTAGCGPWVPASAKACPQQLPDTKRAPGRRPIVGRVACHCGSVRTRT